MAMKPLVEGECGGSNPLMRVAQHLTQTPDILAETRLKSEHLLSDQWAEELLRNTCTSRFQALEDENRFKMDSILHALEKSDMGMSGSSLNATSLPPLNNSVLATGAAGWANEFLTGKSDLIQSTENEVDQFFSKTTLPALNDNSQWAHEYLEKSPALTGSRVLAVTGNAVDLNSLQPKQDNKPAVGGNIWSADFLQNGIDSAHTPTAEPLHALSSLPPTFGNAFNSFSSTEFASTKNTSKPEDNVETVETNKAETATTVETVAEDRDDDELDYWNHMAEEFKKKMNEHPERYEGFFDSPEYNLPGLNEEEREDEKLSDKEMNDQYVFSEDIKKADQETPDNAFELGLKHLKQGELPQAVTCFEVACHRQPEEAKHWQYLGIAQAQNEYDLAAIKALKRCLEIEPSNLNALMSLSVCYTNERMEAQACDTLRRWMMNNNKYNCLLGNDETNAIQPNDQVGANSLEEIGRPASSQQFKTVKEMFITAARLYPYEPDPDVQCGLGVLFNISGEYDKAIDCFRCALNVRPDDPALWNRLGASLANDGQSASAIAAYRRSLELNPGFTRTRYNIGISCISLGAYKEAVEHFLTVLNLQRLSAANGHSSHYQQPGLISQNVWNSLRYVLSMMQRRDLYPQLERRDLDHFNREFGIDF